MDSGLGKRKKWTKNCTNKFEIQLKLMKVFVNRPQNCYNSLQLYATLIWNGSNFIEYLCNFKLSTKPHLRDKFAVKGNLFLGNQFVSHTMHDYIYRIGPWTKNVFFFFFGMNNKINILDGFGFLFVHFAE